MVALVRMVFLKSHITSAMITVMRINIKQWDEAVEFWHFHCKQFLNSVYCREFIVCTHSVNIDSTQENLSLLLIILFWNRRFSINIDSVLKNVDKSNLFKSAVKIYIFALFFGNIHWYSICIWEYIAYMVSY